MKPGSEQPRLSPSGRFFVGVGSGIATVVAPTYLSDIAPKKIRGTICVLHQVIGWEDRSLRRLKCSVFQPLRWALLLAS